MLASAELKATLATLIMLVPLCQSHGVRPFHLCVVAGGGPDDGGPAGGGAEPGGPIRAGICGGPLGFFFGSSGRV